MALTTTTLASALAAGDNSMTVTSATGFAAGNIFIVDQEQGQVASSYVSGTTIPILRGKGGTYNQAHVSGANITTGLGSDFANPGPQGIATYQIAGKVRTLISYGATGAIALPPAGQDAVAVLNGTSALAMTLAAPTKEIDGSLLIIVGNGKSASTVSVTAGFGTGGAGYTVITMQTGGVTGFILMAMNGSWVIIGAPPITGTSTAVSLAVA